MGKTYLFGFPAVEFDQHVGFGVKPGQHAAHLYMRSEPGNVEIVSGNAPAEQKNVSPEATFFNEGDYQNGKKFLSLGMNAALDYERFSDDSGMKDMFLAMKDYLCATGRNAQQNAVKVMKIRMLNCHEAIQSRLDALRKKNSLSEKQWEICYREEEKLRTLNNYAELFQLQFTGDLYIPEGMQPPAPAHEPEHTFMGHTLLGANGGIWQESYGDLFPHDPSPNDVKQGVGLADCFMLSALTGLADKNPQFIRDAMKDNGDGTVTIRFYDEIKGEKEGDPVTFQPHLVRVNKTVDQTLFGHNLNASSSLWVQMMEKGYAKYMEERRDVDTRNVEHPERSGMGIINEENSTSFIQAFLGEERKSAFLTAYFDNLTGGMLKKKDGAFPNHPEHYLPEEDKLFHILSRAVNEEKATMTAGNSMIGPELQKEYHSLGIRTNHAYTILKCFEKDGKKYIQLRDPYGVFMPGYDKDGKLENRSSRVMGTLKGGTDTMGTFNLELKDFLVYFSAIQGVPEKTSREISEAYKTFRNYVKHPLLPGTEEWNDPSKRDPALDDGDQNLGNYEEKNIDGFDVFEVEDETKAEKKPVSDNDFVIIESQEQENKAAENTQPVGVSEGSEMPVQDDLAEPAEEARFIAELSDGTLSRENLKNAISKSLQDLNSTDSMFYWDNTSNFDHLKGSLTELNKLLARNDSATDQIAKAMVQLRRDADTYADYKTDRITRENQNGRKQSPRALHRLHAAASISSFLTSGTPLTDWPEKPAEQIAIVIGDLNWRSEHRNEPGIRPVPEEKVNKAQSLFESQLAKNPRLKADVDRILHPQPEKDILEDFIQIEVSKPEKATTKEEHKPEKVSDGPVPGMGG